MRLLLDTHIALWVVVDHPKLTKQTRTLIVEAEQVFVSAASVWEISIKHRLQRAQMPVSGQQAMQEFGAAGFQWLDITPAHAAQVDLLPLHHHDPFDRMLIAQAVCEPLRLLTRDSALAAYSELVLRV